MSVLLTSPAYLLAIPAFCAAGGAASSPARVLAITRDRRRQPHALQPGLGPVRLPVQQRLRAVRAAPRRARRRAARASPARHRARRPRRSSSIAINRGASLGRDPRAGDAAPGAARRRRVARGRARRRSLRPRIALRSSPGDAAARRRLLGHAEFQAVGPSSGTAHPTGFPTYTLLGWLASVVLQPFGDAGLPDEPAVGALSSRSRPGSPSTSSRRADRSTLARRRRRPRPGAHAGGLVDRDRTPRPTRSTSLLSRLCCCCCWSPGSDERVAAAGPADRWLVAAAVVVRLSRRQPRPDAAARPRRSCCSCSLVDPGDPARPAPRPRCAVGARIATVVARLPRAAAPSRPVPGAARLRPARTPGTASGTSSSASSSGAASSTRSATSPAQAAARLVDRTSASSARSPRSCRSASRPRSSASRPYALLTGLAAVDHLVLRASLRERGHRPLLPRARC